MGQRRPRPRKNLFLFLLPSLGLLLAACDRNPPATPSAKAALPTVVSLVPAATDLIAGMGAANHLVGVSNYDQNPQVAHLLRVGDYLTTDWERIVALRPQIIITQYAPGRTPAGFEEHLQSLGARQENLHIDRVDDIFAAMTELGNALGEKEKAAQADSALRERLRQVGERAAKFKPTPTLMVIDETGLSVAGQGTFLDDLLKIAGGRNVMAENGPSWPAIDREALLSLSPEVILQLLPGASTQVQAEAMQAWTNTPNVPAVRNHRVILLTGPDVLLPGDQIGDLAEQFERALHPVSDTSQPANTP